MKFYITLLLLVSTLSLQAQHIESTHWNNKKCAIALTYDDGLNVHLDHVVHKLDSLGLKGTFYIPGNSTALNIRMEEWKTIARNGHELGNHTLFHPCAGKSKGREWVNPDYDLDDYSITQIVDEIKLANVLLKALDGKDKRTFAYTCGDMSIGGKSFVDLIKDDFVAARGVTSKLDKWGEVDLFNISAFMINGQTGEELIDLVKKAQNSGTLLVFLFHGVGGEHSLDVSLEAHNQLLDYLKTNENEIWTAPMVEISEFIISKKQKASETPTIQPSKKKGKKQS
jgi:peptidoglycan-N-acetylglucosamine deacetylase